jgi:hypothetical protein
MVEVEDMANLNGHEVGNDGYSQEEPVITMKPFYSIVLH